MFEEIVLWVDGRARTPAGQMAADEALLLHAARPTLRAYRWPEPAVTFGYSQKLPEAGRLAAGRPVVRRWTGGGVVFHGDDLTLALAVPAGHPAAAMTSADFYRALHGLWAGCLAGGVRMAGAGDVRHGAECFACPAPSDILAGTSKILGGAMRRTRNGRLYQGSLLGADASPRQLAEALARRVCDPGETDAIEATARSLESKKYAAPEWNSLR